MSPEDVLALNEQIAAMARAGLPLDKGLDSLAKDMDRGRLRRVTQKLAIELRAGHPLDAALKRQSHSLPQYYAPLVAAGIRSGRLPIVLAKLSLYSKSVSRMRALIWDAMLYPSIVLLFGLLIIGLMSFYIMPQFEVLFTDFGMSLPWITQVILAASHVLGYIICGIIAMVIVIFSLWFASRYSPYMRHRAANFIYNIPLIGTPVRSARLSLFADILSILVEFEVPLPEAFRIAGSASPDPIMAGRSKQIAEELEHGADLASALTDRGLIPEWMAWMTSFGEKQSQLAPALAQVAEVYRREAETRATMLRFILPPFIIVVTAGFITVLFGLAVMMPMAKLLEGLNK